MEEKIEGKKSEQMFMEELSGMLCAIVTMLSSISALSAALLAQSADERGSASFLASKLAEDSARYYSEAMEIKKKREGGKLAAKGPMFDQEIATLYGFDPYESLEKMIEVLGIDVDLDRHKEAVSDEG